MALWLWSLAETLFTCGDLRERRAEPVPEAGGPALDRIERVAAARWSAECPGMNLGCPPRHRFRRRGWQCSVVGSTTLGRVAEPADRRGGRRRPGHLRPFPVRRQRPHSRGAGPLPRAHPGLSAAARRRGAEAGMDSQPSTSGSDPWTEPWQSCGAAWRGFGSGLSTAAGSNVWPATCFGPRSPSTGRACCQAACELSADSALD